LGVVIICVLKASFSNIVPKTGYYDSEFAIDPSENCRKITWNTSRPFYFIFFPIHYLQLF